MNFFKKLSISTLSLSMLFANVKAVPTENTICYWDFGPDMTLNFDSDGDEFYFSINSGQPYSLDGRFKYPICMKYNDTITYATIFGNTIYMATPSRVDMKIAYRKKIYFDTLNLKEQQQCISRALNYLSSENLQIPYKLRWQYFNDVSQLITIEQNNFLKESQLPTDDLCYNNILGSINLIKTNLLYLLSVNPDTISQFMKNQIANTVLATKKRLQNLEASLQGYYQRQNNILREQEKKRQDLLNKAMAPKIVNSESEIPAKKNCSQKALKPTQAQKEDLKEKARSQKSKPAKTQSECSYEVCPKCGYEGVYRTPEQMFCINLGCKRITYDTSKTISKQVDYDLQRLREKCREIYDNLKSVEKSKYNMLDIISCVKEHGLDAVKGIVHKLNGKMVTPAELVKHIRKELKRKEGKVI